MRLEETADKKENKNEWIRKRPCKGKKRRTTWQCRKGERAPGAEAARGYHRVDTALDSAGRRPTSGVRQATAASSEGEGIKERPRTPPRTDKASAKRPRAEAPFFMAYVPLQLPENYKREMQIPVKQRGRRGGPTRGGYLGGAAQHLERGPH